MAVRVSTPPTAHFTDFSDHINEFDASITRNSRNKKNNERNKKRRDKIKLGFQTVLFVLRDLREREREREGERETAKGFSLVMVN